MNNSDFVAFALRNMVQNAMRSGGNQFLEDAANLLTVEQLEYLKRIISRVLDKKKNTVDTNR